MEKCRYTVKCGVDQKKVWIISLRPEIMPIVSTFQLLSTSFLSQSSSKLKSVACIGTGRRSTQCLRLTTLAIW